MLHLVGNRKNSVVPTFKNKPIWICTEGLMEDKTEIIRILFNLSNRHLSNQIIKSGKQGAAYKVSTSD